ncbi:MAG: hypothetical protein K6F80_03365 [Oscillospiraceae bacterium]|jgi:uncharacterized protein YxjI|nr:hypothetical protein [Oscillospiraceae bacterium]
MAMDLVILPKGSGKYDILDTKDRIIYTVTKKKRLIGNPITTLHDASGYALYRLIRTEFGKKPAFQIVFNEKAFMAVKCESLFVDPTITFNGGSYRYELRGKDSRELKLFSYKDEIGTLITERQANNEPKYRLSVENKYFDDFIPLFAVVADKCFNGTNK